jgi:hypothetical protein
MANSLIEEEISKELEHLPFDKQKKVLEFVRSLVSSPTTGVTGKELLKFAGTLADDQACEIKEIIERDCEKIDISNW